MASVSRTNYFCASITLLIHFKKNNSFSYSLPEEPDPEAKPRSPPVFVSKPESIQVEEGEWARFCVRVTGHPRPRVMWLINGHTVVNVSCSCKHEENYFLMDFLYLDGEKCLKTCSIVVDRALDSS